MLSCVLRVLWTEIIPDNLDTEMPYEIITVFNPLYRPVFASSFEFADGCHVISNGY